MQRVAKIRNMVFMYTLSGLTAASSEAANDLLLLTSNVNPYQKNKFSICESRKTRSIEKNK